MKNASEQARADARCDAETLVLHILQSLDLGLRGEDTDVDWHLGRAIYFNRSWITRAIKKGRTAEAWSRTYDLAHAAFLAVPGLRGEDTSNRGAK